MSKKHQPRFGSMQVWPRKRAKRHIARVRSWASGKDAKPLGFAGYKAGMTFVHVTETRKTSHLKGEKVRIPVTILECPPMRIYGLRGYKKSGYGVNVAKELHFKADKALERKLDVAKKLADAKAIEALNAEEFEYVTMLVHTQPRLTGIGKKKPDVLELNIGGSVADQLTFVKEHLDKPLSIADVFAAGDMVDSHAITKGKGFQGPVKRFGIGLKPHKSEKGRRAPGSLGPWISQGHISYRIAHAGQMGYHLRTQYNNQIMKIGDKTEEIMPKGDLLHFGQVKNQFVLVRGSLQGPKKRLITLTKPIRGKEKAHLHAIDSIHTGSQQGA